MSRKKKKVEEIKIIIIKDNNGVIKTEVKNTFVSEKEVKAFLKHICLSYFDLLCLELELDEELFEEEDL